MNINLLNYLVCPISHTELKCEIISSKEENTNENSQTIISEALLFSDSGFIYPVIDGIPRLLIEGVYDFEVFLKKHIEDFAEYKANLLQKHGDLIKYCQQKNLKSKKSFAFEWSLLNPEKNDRLWNASINNLEDVLQNELGISLENLNHNICIDIGCGHGLMTKVIASKSKLCIGIEASKAIENAFLRNTETNAFYVQADLQYLPFQSGTFDVAYCSGVIHHTNNTFNSFKLIELLVKKKGLLCLWLYHPQKKVLHWCFLHLRKITRRLPIKITYCFLLIFIFPLSYTYKRLKNKKYPNTREEMINLLDMFSPEFREEIEHITAQQWLKNASYNSINITTTDQFGFSITGKKV